MKYVTFDIECAQYFPQSTPICNFGYVIADENFQILKRKDLIINPKMPFRLEKHYNRDDSLPYRQSDYDQAKKFDEVYSEILRFLDNDYYILIGHSMFQKIPYLLFEAKRYQLSLPNFRYFDLAILYKKFLNEKELVSMRKIADHLQLKLTSHKSDENALIMMKGVQHLLESSQKNLQESLNFWNEGYEEVKNFGQKKIKIRQKNSFDLFLEQYQTTSLGEKLEGKRICFSTFLENNQEYLPFVKFIIDQGGIYTKCIDECHIFVMIENKPCKRFMKIQENCIQDLQIMNLQAFTKMIEES